ncbi:hypothetical protein BJY52DRAFT_1299478, partial [Lactarius psammicola]
MTDNRQNADGQKKLFFGWRTSRSSPTFLFLNLFLVVSALLLRNSVSSIRKVQLMPPPFYFLFLFFCPLALPACLPARPALRSFIHFLLVPFQL